MYYWRHKNNFEFGCNISNTRNSVSSGNSQTQINYSCGLNPTRAFYSGQVDGFRKAVHFRPKMTLTLEMVSDLMHTLPRNSAGHTLLLFFDSFRRSKSALCHLLCKATCSLGTDKQLGNVTSVVEYSKIVTAQQLGDRIMHIIHIFLRIRRVSRLKYNSWIEKTYSNDDFN